MTGIFSQLDQLGTALHLGTQQHRVLSQNIANVNTVGYKTQALPFDQILNEIAQSNHSSEALRGLKVETLEGLPERIDGNNVDIESQISQLKRNALIYESFAQILASKMATLRRSISS